jgi:hypothetical protein
MSTQKGPYVYFHNWELPFDIHHEVYDAGPETMLNDCLYRNIADNTQFILSGDLDEIFFPGWELQNIAGKYATLLDLAKYMQSQHQTAAAFMFSIQDFPLEYPDGSRIAQLHKPMSRSSQSYQTEHLFSNVMRKTLTKYRFAITRGPKLIIVPDRVRGLKTHELHSALPGFAKREVIVKKRLGIVHHYRRINTTDMYAYIATKRELARDLNMLKKYHPFLPPGFRIDERAMLYAEQLEVRYREVKDVFSVCNRKISQGVDMMN